MAERLDPLEAQRPPRPPAAPLRYTLLGLAIFLAGSALSFFLFTVILVLAAPSRNTPLGILGVFVLIAGSGLSTSLALVQYQRRVNRWRLSQLGPARGEVFNNGRGGPPGDGQADAD